MAKSNAAVRPVTFDVNDPTFLKCVAEAMALQQALARSEKAAKQQPRPVKAARHSGKATGKAAMVEAHTEGQAAMDALVIKAFKAAGFGQVVPRQDVRTYNKWLESGLKVKAGERALKVKQFRLFHASQCEAFTPPKEEAAPAPAKPVVVNLKRRAKPSQPSLGV